MALTNAERQRRFQERLRAKIEAMPKIACACGCGTLIAPINKCGEPARYAHGHNGAGAATRFKPGNSSWWKGKTNPHVSRALAGIAKTPASITAREQTRRARNGGRYTRPDARGWRHTEEARAKMSAAKTGERHPSWRGGVSFLPYGPGFTKALKRAIKERDGYVCRRCDRRQDELSSPLHVHHVDADKANNDPSNLVTLCASCNGWFVHHPDESLRMFGHTHDRVSR